MYSKKILGDYQSINLWQGIKNKLIREINTQQHHAAFKCVLLPTLTAGVQKHNNFALSHHHLEKHLDSTISFLNYEK